MDDDFGKDNSQDEIALELAKHEEAMEEAAAEEAFIAGDEDVSVNPLVPEVKNKTEFDTEGDKGDEILGGAFGSGELNPVGTPFNNEEALKDESTSEAEAQAEAEAKPDGMVEPAVEAAPKIGQTAPVEEVKEMNSDPVAENPAPEPKAEMPLFAAGAAAAPVAGEAPKKKKKGLVILIVVLLLLIAGGLAAFFIIRALESPERQISDAIQKLYTAEATQFSGEITFKPKIATSGTDSDSAAALASMINIKLSVDGASKGANATGSGKLSIGVMGQSMEASVSGAYIANDGIYFKLDGLGTLAESMNLSDAISNLFSAQSTMDESEAEIAEEVAKILASSVLEKLDGGWYKIDSSSFTAGSEEAKTYSCVNEAMGKITSSDTKKQIAEAYKKHPVIVYDDSKENESEDGLTFFAVKTDEKASEELAKEVENIDALKSLSACLDSSDTPKKSDAGTGIKLGDDDKTKTEIMLGITGWTHELKAVKGSVISDSLEMAIDIKINYEDKAVNAPEGSKNVSGLMGEVKKDVAEKLKSSPIWENVINEQCADAYRKSGGRMTPAQCQVAMREELKKQFETEAYDKMIDEMFEKFELKSSLKSASTAINL